MVKKSFNKSDLFFKRVYCHFLVFLATQVFIEVYMKAFHKLKMLVCRRKLCISEMQETDLAFPLDVT